MTSQGPAPNGVLVVDKPSGPTSHGVVSAGRKALGTRKVGHAGTLDPMASGVLVLGVGVATRLLTFVVGADKEYEATIRLGVRTSTEDAEGELVERASPDELAPLDEAAIDAAMADLRGEIDQVPSAVSAIKVNGKRAYQRVREGEEVELDARRVTIFAFDRLGTPVRIPGEPGEGPVAIDLRVHVTCSSGTYVRALARDLGDALGVGAHLTALRRTRVGAFSIDEAIALDRLAGDAPAGLMTPSDAARRILPALELRADEAVDLGHGKRIVRDDVSPDVPAAAFAPDGRLVGVVTREGGAYRPLMNLPEAPA
ncbi:tRNA pseudouridine synthase B [Pseudoclavibacter endophyticus]|uniref:tRNA pseudouridine synthase B n=1 Tax=Pseudoclavibacter endophyticus TaxID=1778590 RepID=A0A6H9WM43_9MICO|nr:tRNA pseudouridine(55) synthase TruB [Pseudoclavibacter endophyticus]KAB1649916.1 tRNA pseudouridine(55) synthase TruB [Pseudoclavibacter endophyticus]GGA58755.1 tRNA pseudouridine synthase B [Pseudoclavibacter endophyticus]